MAAILKEIESQALQLSPPERSELIHRLIVSLEGEPEESPEAIAKAWDEEIARRVADMEAGRTQWTCADEVMTRLRTRCGSVSAMRRNRSGHGRSGCTREPAPYSTHTGRIVPSIPSAYQVAPTRYRQGRPNRESLSLHPCPARCGALHRSGLDGLSRCRACSLRRRISTASAG